MTITLRQGWIAVRLLVVMTLLLGVVYPLAIWTVGRLVPSQADGSFIAGKSGTVVGSSLIGQSFVGAEWFHPRPSAAGDGYDALASGGSNLALDNPALVSSVGDRKEAVVTEDSAAPGSAPPDAVTASGSGLDPDISPAYAHLQAPRIAKARAVDAAAVDRLIDEHTTGRTLGFIGQPRVNVLELNIALESLR
jgi:K+-transporting ATPase ATPase C chain